MLIFPGPTAPPWSTSSCCRMWGVPDDFSPSASDFVGCHSPSELQAPRGAQGWDFSLRSSPHGRAWEWEWAQLRAGTSRGFQSPYPCRCQNLLHPSILHQNISLSQPCEPEIQKPFCRDPSQQHWPSLCKLFSFLGDLSLQLEGSISCSPSLAKPLA